MRQKLASIDSTYTALINPPTSKAPMVLLRLTPSIVTAMTANTTEVDGTSTSWTLLYLGFALPLFVVQRASVDHRGVRALKKTGITTGWTFIA